MNIFACSILVLVALLVVDTEGRHRKRHMRTIEDFKKSPLFVPLFDENVSTIPEEQRVILNKGFSDFVDMIKLVLKDAIEMKDDLFPTTKLYLKYGDQAVTKLNDIQSQLSKVDNKVNPDKTFFAMLSEIIRSTKKVNDQLKEEKRYDSDSVKTDELLKMCQDALDYANRVSQASPVGPYLMWKSLKFYQDDKSNKYYNKSIGELVGDALAQFRAIGYDSAGEAVDKLVEITDGWSRGDKNPFRRVIAILDDLVEESSCDY